MSEGKINAYQACRKLRINYSTGKSIIKHYQKTGILFERKSERRVDQTSYNISHQTQVSMTKKAEEINSIIENAPRLPTMEFDYFGYVSAPCYHFQEMPLFYLMFNPYEPQLSRQEGLSQSNHWNDLNELCSLTICYAYICQPLCFSALICGFLSFFYWIKFIRKFNISVVVMSAYLFSYFLYFLSKKLSKITFFNP